MRQAITRAISLKSCGMAAALAMSALLWTPQAAQAQGKAPIMVPLLLCPWGCGNTETSTMLMNAMVKDGNPVTLLPQETPGYMYNIREMNNDKNWKTTAFGTEDGVLQLAKWGGTSEVKEFIPEKLPTKFQLLYGDAWWAQGKFFVTFDPTINSPADLKGKRIGLGLRSQSDWGFFSRLILEYGYGITPQNADIRHLTPAALTQQLMDGSIDAAITVFAAEPNNKEFLIPGLMRQLESSSKPVRYISVSKEAIDKVNAKFGTTFLHITVPAGKLPKLNEPLGTGVARGYIAVHPTFSEEAAYQIVMSVAKHAPKMRGLHPLWKIWSPELMMHGLSEDNIHPGAKKAYVELGWWDQVKKFPAVTYSQ